MNRFIALSLITFVLASCEDKVLPSSAHLPDNVKEDSPTILKEGEAIVLIPEGDKALMIGATVINGKLAISEIDPEGRSLDITWHDKDSWRAATTIKAEDEIVYLIDNDGDGMPDLKAVMKDGELVRYKLKSVQWEKISKENN